MLNRVTIKKHVLASWDLGAATLVRRRHRFVTSLDEWSLRGEQFRSVALLERGPCPLPVHNRGSTVTITPSGTRVIPPLSPTLEINERFRALQAQGANIVHLGFGEAGLPVADILIEALTAGASDNAYGAVAGSSALRESVAAYFTRRSLPTEARQVMLGPGSKSAALRDTARPRRRRGGAKERGSYAIGPIGH